MTDEEIIAVAKAVGNAWKRGDHAYIESTQLLRLVELAERGPVMPEEPTEEILKSMWATGMSSHDPNSWARNVYESLRAYLMKPPARWTMAANWDTRKTRTSFAMRGEAEDAAVEAIKTGAKTTNIERIQS